MPETPDQDFGHLLKLLDEDNEQTVSVIMSELLRRDAKALSAALCELQESDNPRLRRRVHQLQSAIRSRKRRALVAAKFEHNQYDLLDALIQLHLLWYDHDLRANVSEQWQELETAFLEDHPSSLQEAGEFFARYGFKAPARDDMEAAYYSIGFVLDELFGSDLILSAITVTLLRRIGLRVRLVRQGPDFGVADPAGNVLFPGHEWAVQIRSARTAEIEAWWTPRIVRFILAVFFVCSGASDGFRYFHIIGSMLAKDAGKDDLSFLPYPFCSSKNQEDSV